MSESRVIPFHDELLELTDDDHTQYALLAGRATPQQFNFGTASGAATGYLSSTAHATKGKYFLNAAGTITVDDANVRFGIATASPSFDLSFGHALERIIALEQAGAGTGGQLTLRGGQSGAGLNNGGAVNLIGGQGSGNGGSTNVDGGVGVNIGGNVNINGGDSIFGPSQDGNVNIGATRGNVQIGASGATLTVSSNANFTGTLTAATGTFSGLLTANAGSLHGDNDKAKFGDASDAAIYYDGTNLVIDPSEVGSGGVTLNGKNFLANLCGFGGSAGNSGMVIEASLSSSTITRIFSSTLTYTGTSAAMRTMSFNAVHSGSASNASPVGALFSGSITTSPTGTCSVLGVNATADVSGAITAGTKTLRGVVGNVTDTSGGHSGGTVHAASIVGTSPGAFTGFTTINRYAGLFDADVQISTNSMLILEGSLTTKGDSGFRFNTTTANKIQTLIDNAVAIDFRAATFNVADPYDMVLGATTGTKFGTATTQKLAFHNSTPVIQRAGAAQAAVSTTASTNVAPFGYTTAAQADAIVTLVNEIRATLVEKGLMKGAA